VSRESRSLKFEERWDYTGRDNTRARRGCAPGVRLGARPVRYVRGTRGGRVLDGYTGSRAESDQVYYVMPVAHALYYTYMYGNGSGCVCGGWRARGLGSTGGRWEEGEASRRRRAGSSVGLLIGSVSTRTVGEERLPMAGAGIDASIR
jgi:hypothetical protein